MWFYFFEAIKDRSMKYYSRLYGRSRYIMLFCINDDADLNSYMRFISIGWIWFGLSGFRSYKWTKVKWFYWFTSFDVWLCVCLFGIFRRYDWLNSSRSFLVQQHFLHFSDNTTYIYISNHSRMAQIRRRQPWMDSI